MAAGCIDVVAARHSVLAGPTVLDRIATCIHAIGGSRSDLRLVVLRLALVLVMGQGSTERRTCQQRRDQQRHAQARTHARTGRHHAVRASRELRGDDQHAQGGVPHLAVNPIHGSRPSFCVFGGIRQHPDLDRHGDWKRTASGKKTAPHATGETHGRVARSNGSEGGCAEDERWRRGMSPPWTRRTRRGDVAEKTCKRISETRCRVEKRFPHSPSPHPEMMQKNSVCPNTTSALCNLREICYVRRDATKTLKTRR